MAYKPHALVSFGGTLGAGLTADSWQCGVRVCALAQPTTQTLGGPDLYLAAIQTAVGNWFAGAQVNTVGSESQAMRQDATLQWLKVNNIDAAGRYQDRSKTNVYFYPTPFIGPGLSGIPPFVTLAVSMTTAKSRGPGHRGRIYLPFNIPANGSNVYGGVIQAFGRKVKSLLSILEGTPDGGSAGGAAVRAVVASKVDASLNPITGVAIGNIYDVQRRRKEQAEETYTALAYP